MFTSLKGSLYNFPSCLLFGWLIILLPQSASSQAVLTLAKDEEYFSPGRYLYILEDKIGKLTREEVNRLPLTAFRLSKEDEPNIGFSSSVYWVKFFVFNMVPDTEWLLEYRYPPMDSITLYSGLNSTNKVQQAGDSLPFSERPIPHRNHVFKLEPKPGQITAFLLRFKSDSSVVFPLRIWQKDAFIAADAMTNLLIGGFLMLLLVMIVYNIPIYITTREKAYIPYNLFILVNFFFQLQMTGVGAMYLWPTSSWWSNQSLLIFSSLSVTFSMIFTIVFLQTKQWIPLIHRFLLVLLVLTSVNSLLSPFIPYSISIRITNFLLIILSTIFIFIAIFVYIKGYLPARYYLIAWSVLLVAVF
ncbi:MAG: 7TM-DISM domain-containing protein, partial [Spirochaetota bacterium]